jgi:hypothetical protein
LSTRVSFEILKLSPLVKGVHADRTTPLGFYRGTGRSEKRREGGFVIVLKRKWRVHLFYVAVIFLLIGFLKPEIMPYPLDEAFQKGALLITGNIIIDQAKKECRKQVNDKMSEEYKEANLGSALLTGGKMKFSYRVAGVYDVSSKEEAEEILRSYGIPPSRRGVILNKIVEEETNYLAVVKESVEIGEVEESDYRVFVCDGAGNIKR